MKHTIIALFFCLSFVCSVANSATQPQIDQAWNKGLAWMMLHQRSDGSWSDSQGSPQTTAEFIGALSSVNLNGSYTFLGGISWLSNIEAASVDALSRQTGALTAAGANALAPATKLLAWRNRLNAWGAYPQYETSLPDTPLAVMSVLDAMGSSYSNTDLSSAVCQFVPAQLPDNHLWPYSAETGTTVPAGQRSGAVIPTVYAILALNKVATTPGRLTSVTCSGTAYPLSTVINNAIAGLLSKKKSNNGFGDGDSSTMVATALVYRVLKTLQPSDPATASALDYLLAQQANDGSWGGTAYFSAVVLASLPAPSPSVLVDTDQDGIPDGVELILGTNPLVADSRFLPTVTDPRFFDPDTPQILSITRN